MKSLMIKDQKFYFKVKRAYNYIDTTSLCTHFYVKKHYSFKLGKFINIKLPLLKYAFYCTFDITDLDLDKYKVKQRVELAYDRYIMHSKKQEQRLQEINNGEII